VNKKTYMAALLILIIFAGTWLVIERKKALETTPVMTSLPLPVAIAEAKEGSISMSAHYLGTVLPMNAADISPRITGNILSVTVREGDPVHKGQLLAALDERQLKAKENAQMLDAVGTESQLAGARSVYEAQQAVYDRDDMLYKEGAISLEALQRSKAQRDSSLAQTKSLEEKVKALKNIAGSASTETAYARLLSPIDGVVTKRLQEPGDLAVPGKPILRVEGRSHFRVVVQVPEKDMPLMKKGGAVILSNSGKQEALITRVYPAASVGTLGTIEIDILQRPLNIISGGTVGVDVITGKTEPGIVLPLSALLETERGKYIFKVEAGTQGEKDPAKLKIVPVEVLGKNNENACVKGGIKSGDQIITGDEGKLLKLSDGMAVAPSGSSRGHQ
jgi:RND family efflux transporter MFP subunit